MPKSKESAAELVYEAAARLENGPLRRGTSLFTDREGLWRGEPVREVHDRLVDRVPAPDESFEEILDECLDGASEAATLLTAELVYLHLMVAPPSTIDGETKHDCIHAILSRIEDPPDVPDLLDMALDAGLAPTGDGFVTLRYWMVRYLAAFLRKWAGCTQTVRESLLEHAWAFREFAFSLDTQKSQTQRHALVHLLFPKTFEPIVSESSKQTIAGTFSQFVDDPDANVDQQLIQIRAGLARKLGSDFVSFYDDKLRWQWQSDDWEQLLEFAGRFYRWDGFDEAERRDWLAIADDLAAAREAFLDDEAWRDRLRSAVGPSNTVAGRALKAHLLRWLDDHPETAEDALDKLWAREASAYERLGGFFQLVPDEVGNDPETRLGLASFLLMGVEGRAYPFYRAPVVRDVLNLVEYPVPDAGDPVETYRHALGFFDALIEDLAGRGVVCRDRLDARALVHMVVRTHPGDLDFLDPGVRRRFADFVGRDLARRRDIWIFQANPDHHDDLEAQLAEAVGSESIIWSVTAYEDEIDAGDLVLVWRSGDEAGALVAGEITDEPRPRDEDGTFLRSDDDHGVAFRPTVMLDDPLTRETLKDDPVLREMRIVTAPRGTNFPVDRRDWRRILAYRPDLADHLPIDRTAQDVALAPFFRRFFNDRREAERFYGVLEEMATKMGARGRGDRRFTMRIEGQSGTRLCLYYAERKMVAIRTADHDGARILLTLDAPHADDLGLEPITDWSNDSDEYDTKFYEVPVQKARNRSDQLGRAFDRGMEATLENYTEWSQSPYRPKSRHLEQAFAAIFDRGYRRQLFLEGIAEPDAVEPLTPEELAEDLFIPEQRLRNLLGLLEHRKNLVLEGPPGVGKSLVAERLAHGVTGQRNDDRIERVQLHDSYTYEDFVQGYRRTDDGGTVRSDGLFYQFCRRAEHDPGHDYVFVIDEIQRGDPSAIFGELTTLIAPDRRGPDDAVLLQHSASDQETFHVPQNVHLVATSNTAAPTPGLDDYVFRRRFAFATLEPAYGREAFTEYLRDKGVPEALCDRINERMTALNQTIAADTPALGPGYRLGHSYFCLTTDAGSLDADWFHRVVRHDIEPLLRQYWQETPEQVDEAIDRLVAIPN